MLPHTGLFLLGKVALQMRIRRRLETLKRVFRRPLLVKWQCTAAQKRQSRSLQHLVEMFRKSNIPKDTVTSDSDGRLSGTNLFSMKAILCC